MNELQILNEKLIELVRNNQLFIHVPEREGFVKSADITLVCMNGNAIQINIKSDYEKKHIKY